MRTCLSLIAALTVVAGTLSAQATTTPTNIFGISPNSTDATSRSGVGGASTGDVLIEVRSLSFENPINGNGATGADFIGIGDMGNTPPPNNWPLTNPTIPLGDGRVNGFQVVIQDQNASTTEPFDFCIVTEASGTAIGNPAAPPAGNAFGPEVILRTAPLTTPMGPATVQAWTITATLQTPADVIPSGLTSATSGGFNSSWYYGVGLSANALWTTDGASIHMSSFNSLGGAPFPNAGDNPRDGVVSLQQARDVTNGTIAGKSTDARTQEIYILTEAPILNHGAVIDAAAQVGPDPNFGAAGNYPDPCGQGNTGRITGYPPYPGRAGVGDGFAFRLRAIADVGTAAVLGLGGGVPGSPGSISGFSGAQVYLPFFDGAFVLTFTSVFFPVGVIPANGELNLTLQGPSAAQPLCTTVATPARMSGQAVLLNPAALRFSNGTSTSFN